MRDHENEKHQNHSPDCGHSFSHDHHSHAHKLSNKGLIIAIWVNLLLTFIEIGAAVVSGSLALFADALHNFSDCAALIIAWVARRISKRQPSSHFTYGYKKSELIGAFFNLTTLIVLGSLMLIEAITRSFNPPGVDGGIVIWVSVIAIIIDVVTALALSKLAAESLNIKAAFLHNIADALSSIVVLGGGFIILRYGWLWVDPLLTAVIAGFILFQSIPLLRKTACILMDGVESPNKLTRIHETIQGLSKVVTVYHLHIRYITEKELALESCVVIRPKDIELLEEIKTSIKQTLLQKFDISHSTIEFEVEDSPKKFEHKDAHPCGYP